jgi:hypothetical protein
MKNQHKAPKQVTPADIKLALHVAMMKDGIAFPESVEDVDRLESLIDNSSVPTPDVNGFMMFLAAEHEGARMPENPENIIIFPQAEFIEHMAAAARNGSAIDPETRKRMNDHRVAAEKRLR